MNRVCATMKQGEIINNYVTQNPNLKSNLPGHYRNFENQLYPKLKNKFGDWFWYKENKMCYTILAFDDESYDVLCDFYPEENKIHMALLNKWINSGWDWIMLSVASPAQRRKIWRVWQRSGTTNYAGFFAGNVFTNGKLTVATTAGTTGIDLAGSDAYAEMRVIRDTLNATDKDLYLGFLSPVGSSLHLYSDGLETVTIKNNGLGVGKSPAANESRLIIKETVVLAGIGIEASGNTNHWDFYVPTGAAADLLFLYNGFTNGTFSSVTGAYTISSDRRLKKDIRPQGLVIDNLMQLQAYQYHYLDNQSTDRLSNGFMAQDVQQLFPDAVVENSMKDGEKRLGINYQYFTVLAIKAV